MGWFNKKEEMRKDMPKTNLPDFPRLPELPELPPLTSTRKESLPQLPSFPASSLGDKFSQTTIKDAVSGRQEFNISSYPEGKKGERTFEADEFASPKVTQMMQRPLKQKEFEMPKTKEIQEDEDTFEDFEVEDSDMPEFEEEEKEYDSPKFDYKPMKSSPGSKKKEPVFIRIDKFEESLKAFEKAKKEVNEIEHMLKEIMKVKDEEEKQLDSWSKEMIRIKEQIDKVDKDIFSKLE